MAENYIVYDEGTVLSGIEIRVWENYGKKRLYVRRFWGEDLDSQRALDCGYIILDPDTDMVVDLRVERGQHDAITKAMKFWQAQWGMARTVDSYRRKLVVDGVPLLRARALADQYEAQLKEES